jgi:hypothetical protein
VTGKEVNTLESLNPIFELNFKELPNIFCSDRKGISKGSSKIWMTPGRLPFIRDGSFWVRQGRIESEKADASSQAWTGLDFKKSEKSISPKVPDSS